MLSQIPWRTEAIAAPRRLIWARAALIMAIALLVLARMALLIYELVQATPAAYLFDEDAYYVLAVARNLAHGRGITADGLQWTNGFQPLWAFILAVPYALFDNERLVLASIGLLSLALWLGSAYLFTRLVGQLVPTSTKGWVPLALATLFLADLQLQAAYFNGLETGLYLTGILAMFVLVRPRERVTSHPTLVGAALGVLVLARNDAIFLCGALLAAWLGTTQTFQKLRAIVIAGGSMTLTVLPWLAFNVWLTGSPVPQSGAATNAGPYASPLTLAKFNDMLARLAQLTFTPFPMNYVSLERLSGPLAALVAAAALSICLILAARHMSLKETWRALWPLALSVVCLCAYYVTSSGAVWMYDRYLMPFKLLALSLWAVFLAGFLFRLQPLAPALAVVGVVGLSFYYQISAPSVGSNMTADLLWLESSPLTDSDEKIGMFESGRSGYALAGRVENLDGKVNVNALRAIQQGTFLDYLRHSDMDVLIFRDYYEPWLDRTYPGWRTVFEPAPADLPGLVIGRRGSTLATRLTDDHAPRVTSR